MITGATTVAKKNGPWLIPSQKNPRIVEYLAKHLDMPHYRAVAPVLRRTGRAILNRSWHKEVSESPASELPCEQSLPVSVTGSPSTPKTAVKR